MRSYSENIEWAKAYMRDIDPTATNIRVRECEGGYWISSNGYHNSERRDQYTYVTHSMRDFEERRRREARESMIAMYNLNSHQQMIRARNVVEDAMRQHFPPPERPQEKTLKTWTRKTWFPRTIHWNPRFRGRGILRLERKL